MTDELAEMAKDRTSTRTEQLCKIRLNLLSERAEINRKLSKNADE